MTLMTLEQLTQIDQTDQTGQTMKMKHQRKERNRNVDLEKEAAMDTEESCHPTNPDKSEAEQIQLLLLSYKSSGKLQINSPSRKGWKLEYLTLAAQYPAYLYHLQRATI